MALVMRINKMLIERLLVERPIARKSPLAIPTDNDDKGIIKGAKIIAPMMTLALSIKSPKVDKAVEKNRIQ